MMHNKVSHYRHMKQKELSLEALRKEAAEKKAEKEKKRKASQKKLNHLTVVELHKLRNTIASEYMRAPRDKKPTPREAAEKHNIDHSTVRLWYKQRGFYTSNRRV